MNSQGREPGTEGEAKTLKYLGRDSGFPCGPAISGTNDPGNEWFAPVTLVAREPASSSKAAVHCPRRGKVIAVPADAVLLLTSAASAASSATAPLVVRRPCRQRTRLFTQRTGRAAWRSCWMMASENSVNGRSALLNAGRVQRCLTVLDGSRTLEQIAARRQAVWLCVGRTIRWAAILKASLPREAHGPPCCNQRAYSLARIWSRAAEMPGLLRRCRWACMRFTGSDDARDDDPYL